MSERFDELDLSLYLVLDPDLCGGLEGMLRTADLAAAYGATVVQLRTPVWKKRQCLLAARKLKEVLAPYRLPLIINDHVDVALAADADGVHLGQDDLPVAEARRLLGSEKILGLSVSSSKEMANVPAGVDYLGIGPVYPTGTKLDAAAATGASLFAALRAETVLPVVAIGGVNAENCSPLFASGSDGIAVVSAICGQPDPAEATRLLRDAILSVRGQRNAS